MAAALVTVLVASMFVHGCFSWPWRPGSPGHGKPIQTGWQRPIPVGPPSNEAYTVTSERLLRIRVAHHLGEFALSSPGKLELDSPLGKRVLSAGTYALRASSVVPARQTFHVFAKTFKAHERSESEAYVEGWRAKGYSPQTLLFGEQFGTDSDVVLDNRIRWISVAHFETQEQAESLKAELEKQNQWCWIRAQTRQSGSASLTFKEETTGATWTVPIPASLSSDAGISLMTGYAGVQQEKDRAPIYSGTIEVGIGPEGRIEAYEIQRLETYLKGVLPAEMPSDWPLEALEAQAVAARSDSVANLRLRHELEGFDFCSLEHCRAYSGRTKHTAATDLAVAATEGQVLSAGGRVVPTVFSANCGGHTEDNDTAWSAPPDPVLRGVSDVVAVSPGRSYALVDSGIENWLRHPPQAYCGADTNTFRWKREFTADELSRVLNRQYAIGAVRNIELGDRGVSGRLKWVRVTGTEGTVTIRKELPIRLAFGNLPSAMFIIDAERSRGAVVNYTFMGGGRGHGVGLCQHGARGRALAGSSYRDILRHYFTNVDIVKVP
ncbi:MAG: SpoIID/LytB domain-containing protein [Candidatus Hydrogenedentes bacterium]|nr:SpoIID/LytB domain-containing protein [Candidatus Hydrogenedentota bacterium]